jgi:thymidylate synthase (FAD)
MIPPARIPVHQHGFVELVGVMVDFADLSMMKLLGVGDENLYSLPQTLDAQIARAARTSYASGTKSVSDDDRLIDRLMRDEHTSPFEQVEFKFLVRMPIFVARQWIRHRTANVNEESGRYSVLKDEMFVPETLRFQSTMNKQGSDRDYPEPENGQFLQMIREQHGETYMAYKTLVDHDVTRELARTVLPVATYTTMVWKIDLHNLLRFLKLRLDPHAQQEIRDYAEAVLQLIEPLVPITIKHWRNHLLAGQRFSRDELDVLKWLFHSWVTRNQGSDESWDDNLDGIAEVLINIGIPQHRVAELARKLELPELTRGHVLRGAALREARQQR